LVLFKTADWKTSPVYAIVPVAAGIAVAIVSVVTLTEVE